VLTSIDVGFNNLDEETALSIVRAARQHDRMANLGLAECKIGPNGAKEIAEYVKGSAVLTSIDVSHNKFDEEAALGIVRAARQHDRMTNLGLARCKIGPDGAKEIAEYVQGSAVLKKIMLSYNTIKDEGAIAIGESLKTNNVLEELELRNCYIGNKGAKAISAGLQAGIAVLTKLDLRSNNLDDGAKRALTDANERRRTALELRL